MSGRRPIRGSFVAICHDGPEAPTLRLEHLEAHLKYIEGNLDSVRVAGPIAETIDTPFRGSVFIVAADSEAEARAVLNNDPYFKCGMYADVSVYPFVPAAGTWLGGITWERRGTSSD